MIYTATDPSRNTKLCQFQVTVQGNAWLGRFAISLTKCDSQVSWLAQKSLTKWLLAMEDKVVLYYNVSAFLIIFHDQLLSLLIVVIILSSFLVLRCSALFAPANGRLENAPCGNVYGSVCRMACNKGYELKGSINRKCDKKTGTNAVDWTGNSTSCEGKKK